jgi:hypothetical protein
VRDLVSGCVALMITMGCAALVIGSFEEVEEAGEAEEAAGEAEEEAGEGGRGRGRGYFKYLKLAKQRVNAAPVPADSSKADGHSLVPAAGTAIILQTEATAAQGQYTSRAATRPANAQRRPRGAQLPTASLLFFKNVFASRCRRWPLLHGVVGGRAEDTA